MDRREKIDCRANGDVILRTIRSLLLKDFKNDQSGAAQNTSRSRSPISTKNSIDSHQCITAGNGVEALNKMKRNKVDAVITDIVMPEMDGITLTKEILSLYPYLPIMVITGHSKEYSAEDALAVGARDFIEKPFSIEEFLLRLSKMMRDYEILCQLKVKQNQMVFRLSKKSLEETNDLRREIESLKSRLCSVYNGSF